MSLRRALPDLLAVLLLAVVVVGYFALRPADAPKTVAAKCPPGFDSRDKRTDAERRERAGQTHANPALVDVGAAAEEEGGEEEGEGARCISRRRPESRGELMRMQTETSRRSTGGVARTVKPGAYRAAIATRTRLAADGTTLPGSGGEWKPYGVGPLIADERTYTEASGLGLADLNGRVSDFARDAAGGRLFAAIGEGGVWESTDTGRTWRSIGEGLPTQAVGGIDYSTADGGTIIVADRRQRLRRGRHVRRDGRLPVHRRRPQLAQGDRRHPGQRDRVQGGGRPHESERRVCRHGRRPVPLRRTPARSFANVALPTGEGVAEGEPDCTGKLPTVEGCFLANMVTDVVVQQPDNDATDDGSPGAKAGSVVAVVGWRAGDRRSPAYRSYPDGVKESPSNGVYRSDTGAPGTFERTSMSGFAPKTDIGRIELGHATGPEQDHNYLYALVQDVGQAQRRARRGSTSPAAARCPTARRCRASTSPTTSATRGRRWSRARSSWPTRRAARRWLGSVARLGACPGVQAWYNQFIAPDPTRADSTACRPACPSASRRSGRTTTPNAPQSGKSRFVVTGPYFSGDSCQFLSVLPVCPTTAGDPAEANLTTHPDQHAIEWIPDGEGGVTQVVGHDGGVNVQHVNAGEDIDPDGWGRGANNGFNTLLPYDAQIAKDGTVYAGLQDNGEMKIDAATRKQYMVFGGDGGIQRGGPGQLRHRVRGLHLQRHLQDERRRQDVLGRPRRPRTRATSSSTRSRWTRLASEHLITAGNAVHETDSRRRVVDDGVRPRHPRRARRSRRGRHRHLPEQLDLRDRRPRGPEGDARRRGAQADRRRPGVRGRRRHDPGCRRVLRRPAVAPRPAVHDRRGRAQRIGDDRDLLGEQGRRLGPLRPQGRRGGRLVDRGRRGRELGEGRAHPAGPRRLHRPRLQLARHARQQLHGQGHLQGPRGPADRRRERGVRRVLRLLRPAHQPAVRQRHRHQRDQGRQGRQAPLGGELAHRQGRGPARPLHHVGPDRPGRSEDGLRDHRRATAGAGCRSACSARTADVVEGQRLQVDRRGRDVHRRLRQPAGRARPTGRRSATGS